MLYREIIDRIRFRLRDPLPNEAQLTVHPKDEHILHDILRERGDGEIVQTLARRPDDVSTIYVRCADNDSAGALMEAWAPYLPLMRNPISCLIA